MNEAMEEVRADRIMVYLGNITYPVVHEPWAPLLPLLPALRLTVDTGAPEPYVPLAPETLLLRAESPWVRTVDDKASQYSVRRTLLSIVFLELWALEAERMSMNATVAVMVVSLSLAGGWTLTL